MGSVYCEKEVSLTETVAISPIYCDGSIVSVHNGVAHVTLYIEQPRADVPDLFEKVIIGRIVMLAEAARACAEKTSKALAGAIANGGTSPEPGVAASH